MEYPVNVNFDLVENFPAVKLDTLSIQQVLLSLARNALEAMRDANIPEPKLSIELNLLDKNTLEITMIDNGPGFQQENAAKFFNPNFTTKKYSIGLGLSISQMIVEKHGGQMTAVPHPSGGACFNVTLPCIARNS